MTSNNLGLICPVDGKGRITIPLDMYKAWGSPEKAYVSCEIDEDNNLLLRMRKDVEGSVNYTCVSIASGGRMYIPQKHHFLLKKPKVYFLKLENEIITLNSLTLLGGKEEEIDCPQDVIVKAFKKYVSWTTDCDFGYDNIPDEYEKYKNDKKFKNLDYNEGLIYIAIKETLREEK